MYLQNVIAINNYWSSMIIIDQPYDVRWVQDLSSSTLISARSGKWLIPKQTTDLSRYGENP